MRAIVLKAPFAPLAALGLKVFETRGYRPSGTLTPGDPLAVVSGRKPFTYDEAPEAWDRLTAHVVGTPTGNGRGMAEAVRREGAFFPLGHVLSVSTYGGAVPVVAGPVAGSELGRRIEVTDRLLYVDVAPFHWNLHDMTDQRHLGVFTPGRLAWPLIDTRRLPHPIECRAAQSDGTRISMQGVFTLPNHVAAQVAQELTACP